MNNPQLYQSSNSLQKNDATLCLQEFGKIIQWKDSGDKIIDIGCGDGSVTVNVLKKFIPPNYEKIVGCDVSTEMINFATLNHSTTDTKFIVLDIEGKLPESLRKSFDHAFSFYTLHWINHQESAFANIYDLLVDGGDCLLVFLAHMPIYDVLQHLSRTERWRYWLKDVDRFISPYHESLEPEKEVKMIMEKVGFTSVEVKSKHMTYVYHSITQLKEAITAISPFRMPNEVHRTFMDDYINKVRDMRMMEQTNNDDCDSVNVTFNYSLLVVYAKK